MNAQLLTILSNAAPAKSGISALLSKVSGAKDDGMSASFADLLGQQTDSLDPELLAMLSALGMDPQTQKTLLTQVKTLNATAPEQLHKLIQQLKSTEDPKQLLTTPRQTPANHLESSASKTVNPLEKNTKDSTSFVINTLFIANESKAIRLGASSTQRLSPAAVFGNTDKDKTPPTDIARFGLSSQDGQKNDNRFDLRLDLQNDSRSKTANAAENAPKKALPTFNSIQATLNPNSEDAKSIAPSMSSNTAPLASASSSLLTELNGLTAQTTPSTQTANSLANAPFSATYSAQITTPVQQTAQWGADFGRVMVQMSQQAGQTHQAGLQTAEIRLDPPELGPMRIMLSINEGVANAMFFAAHAQTRQAIELSLPQLQQQLAQSGLSLGEANVSDQSFFAQSEQQSEQNKGEGSETFHLHGIDQGVETETLHAANTKQSTSPDAIIDTFA